MSKNEIAKELEIIGIKELPRIFKNKFSLSIEDMQELFSNEFMIITQEEVDNYIKEKNATYNYSLEELKKMYEEYNKNIPFFSRMVILKETEEILLSYIKKYNILLKATFAVEHFKNYIDILRTKGYLYCMIFQGISERTVNLEELLKLDIVIKNDFIRKEDVDRLLEVIEYIFLKEKWLLEKANNIETYSGKYFPIHWDVDEKGFFCETSVYPTNKIYCPNNSLWLEKTCIPLSEQGRKDAIERSMDSILKDPNFDGNEQSRGLEPYYLTDKVKQLLLTNNN